MSPADGPRVVGVMGGSFNPIHLGHALLAITVHQTKPVDEVLLVPVFKHPVKKDLLPFEDRVAMCELAVSASGIGVSSVEQETEESNVVMLRALRKKYPEGSKLLWVCGDDVFEWISNERGQAMLCELDGLIVQRRLHKAPDNQTDRFYQAPVDSDLVRALVAEHQVHVDFIYGELPHYSSTLVRNSPASWRAFLPQKVAAYLDERPALLAQLVRSGDAPPAQMTPPSSPLGEMAECEDLDDEMESVLETEAPEKLDKPVAVGFVDLVPDEETSASTPSDAAELPHILGSILRSKRTPVSRSPNRKRTVSRPPSGQRLREAALSCVMRCLATVHSLQRERGQTALALALRGSPEGDVAARKLRNLRRATTETLQGDEAELLHAAGFAAGAAGAVAEELRHVPKWLSYDRALLDQLLAEAPGPDGPQCWMRRSSLLDKFNVRVDVLIDACVRALGELMVSRTGAPLQVWSDYDATAEKFACDEDNETTGEWLLSLFQQYADCKEALGRLRCFVAAGGQNAPHLIRTSFRARRRLNEVIEHKDRMLRRVLSTEQASPGAEHPGAHTAAALHKMLRSVSQMEFQLMGCFARSTPLEVMHEALANRDREREEYDVAKWFGTLTSVIDLMVTLDQALAAFICTYSEGSDA
mmetsp:Transcript_72153/g.169085  ORF Transcript_72153/g.169085 Transcript_72153/m.169085 type:complete len:645 (-) Transcript_72153:88-2022(-)